MNSFYRVVVTNDSHTEHAEAICKEMEKSAKKRGTGISRRDPEDIKQVMREGRGIIALDEHGNWAGFSYLQGWGKDNKEFVSNSGLIVSPNARGAGLAKRIKKKVFYLSRAKFPNAKVFSITTGASVMKMNSKLGFKPVTYSNLPQDDEFWAGCKSCPNYDTLKQKKRKMCFCTAMMFDPKDQEHKAPVERKQDRPVFAVRERRTKHREQQEKKARAGNKHMTMLSPMLTGNEAMYN